MLMAHRNGRRLAVLTGLFVALALGAATHVAAYPITPDGEPLYLDRGTPQSSTVGPMPNESAVLRRARRRRGPPSRSTRCPRPS